MVVKAFSEGSPHWDKGESSLGQRGAPADGQDESEGLYVQPVVGVGETQPIQEAWKGMLVNRPTNQLSQVHSKQQTVHYCRNQNNMT